MRFYTSLWNLKVTIAADFTGILQAIPQNSSLKICQRTEKVTDWCIGLPAADCHSWSYRQYYLLHLYLAPPLEVIPLEFPPRSSAAEKSVNRLSCVAGCVVTGWAVSIKCRRMTNTETDTGNTAHHALCICVVRYKSEAGLLRSPIWLNDASFQYRLLSNSYYGRPM